MLCIIIHYSFIFLNISVHNSLFSVSVLLEISLPGVEFFHLFYLHSCNSCLLACGKVVLVIFVLLKVPVSKNLSTM